MLLKVFLIGRKRERKSKQRATEQLRKARKQNQGLECKVWGKLQRKIQSKLRRAAKFSASIGMVKKKY